MRVIHRHITRMGLGALLLAIAADAATPLLSPWGEQVAAAKDDAPVLPEYPRPQLVRDRWQNLNGMWDLALSADPLHPPDVYPDRIRVPFPIESHLSGVGQRLDEHTTLWYRRRFSPPADWKGQRIKLHVGAVDWEASIFLNGHPVGFHQGAYDAFSLDLTPYLAEDGDNELVFAVRDPTEADQPRGKQSVRPQGIFYLPSSGIWQTVWLEPVPRVHIQRSEVRSDWEAGALRVQVLATGWNRDLRVEVEALLDGQPAGSVTGSPGAWLTLPLQPARSWSPSEPTLYDLVYRLKDGDEILDQALGYAGLRDIRLGPDDQGRQVLWLNGRPLFQNGVLDQGFWPGGLYTAPSDQALRFDLETAKQLGLNMVRKHVKVEPQRWYAWADRLGLLIWQDMPSGDNATEAGRRQFETELQRMMMQLANHPSVVMWVLFNEGWGQYDTKRLTHWMKNVDPDRLVNNASGWTDADAGDVIDLHSYPGPEAPPPEPTRASVLGEFGGLGLGVPGHQWSDTIWGYRRVSDPITLTWQHGRLLDQVGRLRDTHGLAAAVYTQMTDVESECNGFLSYDRRILKMDLLCARYANLGWPPPPPSAMLLPTAREQPIEWHYTVSTPPDAWPTPDYDDTHWPTGPAGFGTPATPGAVVGTPWDTDDIWLRTRVTLPDHPLPNLALVIHHDEDVEVFFNGVPALKMDQFRTGYRVFPIHPEARAALRPGPNHIAVHCTNRAGGQFIDVGLLAEPWGEGGVRSLPISLPRPNGRAVRTEPADRPARPGRARDAPYRAPPVCCGLVASRDSPPASTPWRAQDHPPGPRLRSWPRRRDSRP